MNEEMTPGEVAAQLEARPEEQPGTQPEARPDESPATPSGLHAHAVTATAIEAARAAGALALEGFRSADLQIEQKQGIHDLVTQYDRACEALISERILANFPDSTIVGEEAGTREGSGSVTWYIDPIDGTANYARGIAMWAISIAAELNGELVTGVIYDPVAEQLFWADDRGAFLGDATTDVLQPLRSTGNTAPADATVALNFPLPRDLAYKPELALSQFAEVTRTFAQVRGLGSTCIALAWIAAGWLDATVSFETASWDVAAGAHIVRRAGGVFEGYRAGETVDANRAHLAPHYYAEVAGADFELLAEIMRTQSMRPEK